MKMKQKFPKKAHGAYIASAVKSLRRSGLSGDVLKTAIDAVCHRNNVKKIRLPRQVAAAIVKRLAVSDRVVIVNKGPKRFKVFTLEAYLSMKDTSSVTATTHKPWEHSAKKRAADVISEAVTAS